jgi:hypothetical protein
MNNKKLVLASLVATLVMSAPSFAGWPSAGSLVGGSKSTTDQSGTYKAQDALVAKFLASSTLISNAQLKAAKSLKLDEVVAKVEAEQTAKKGQSVDQLKTNQTVGENLTASIEKAMKDGVQLDSESKKLYLEALVQYSAGLVATKSAADAAPGFMSSAKDTISSASVTEKLSVTNKLQDGMNIAKELPGYTKSLWDTSKLMLSFAKSNKIEVPADATKALKDVSFN